MNMKTLRKILAAICATALIVCISVGATIAYLTSDDQVVNTFTVGKVEITLDETNTDELGVADGTGRSDEGNEYQLYPGRTYLKDPQIHVDANSEDCWVVAKVVVTADSLANVRSVIGYGADKKLLGLNGIVTGGVFDKEYTDNGDGSYTSKDGTIELLQVAGENENTFYIYYLTKQIAGANLELFHDLVIPQEWTNTEIGNMAGLKMDVTAYAVQKDGFDNVKTAFTTAFPGK